MNADLHSAIDDFLTRAARLSAYAATAVTNGQDRESVIHFVGALREMFVSELPSIQRRQFAQNADRDNEDIGISFRHFGPTLGIPSSVFFGAPGETNEGPTMRERLLRLAETLQQWRASFQGAAPSTATDRQLLHVLGPITSHLNAIYAGL
jgi:hypothetical protein